MPNNPKFVTVAPESLDELFVAAKGRCRCSLRGHAHGQLCGRPLRCEAHGTDWHVLDLAIGPDESPADYIVMCKDCASHWIHLGAEVAVPKDDLTALPPRPPSMNE